LRDAVFSSAHYTRQQQAGSTAQQQPPAARSRLRRRSPGERLRPFFLRIVFPTLLAVILFLTAFWGFILPSFEQSLLEQKREMIRELTNASWSILSSYQQEEAAGTLTRTEAQALSITRIETLRYGPEGKDYFWIQTMEPAMVMHPYRPDLNGQNLAQLTDSRGVPIFVEFASLVEQSGEGYIDYVWQWKDDPRRLEAKESYVRGFAPWGWIIGTGVYLDDVHQEIARLKQDLTHTSLAITGGLIVLLTIVLLQSLRIEKARQNVVDNLRESTSRYHALVEAATEGTLLVLENRCTYANPTFLNMINAAPAQLGLLDLEDLLPLPHSLEQSLAAGAQGALFEGSLRTLDGRILECMLAVNPIRIAERDGFILLARETAPAADGLQTPWSAGALASLPAGIFRAQAVRRGVFLEINDAGQAMLPPPQAGRESQPALADLFEDPAQFEEVLQVLRQQGSAAAVPLVLHHADATVRYLSLSASLDPDSPPGTPRITGILQDVTVAARAELERSALIDKLQSSLLFLHEPISVLKQELVTCSLNASITEAARIMTRQSATAAVVQTDNGDTVGIITDHDLRERVLSSEKSPSAAVHTVMSAPLIRIGEYAKIYEALLRMEEVGVRHLAVENEEGRIVSVLNSKTLLQFQRSGPIVLTREIERATSADEAAQASMHRIPLVQALNSSGARPQYITELISAICDTTTRRLIELAEAELGPPPVPYTFIAMGSQGRQEQTLLTDQDHGIIYAAASAETRQEHSGYFLALGERVSSGLAAAGYHRCSGQVMADNPAWCRTLPEWLAWFRTWLRTAQPQELLELNIFFDFRVVHGDPEPADRLRSAIHAELEQHPAFIPHFARHALTFKPPIRLPGNIYLSRGHLEQGTTLNLKDALMPIISFARLYALLQRVSCTNTLRRIQALEHSGVLRPSTCEDLAAAYEFLMQLRLLAQLESLQRGQQPENTINPSRLTSSQQEMLRHSFSQISAVQKKVSYDYLGGT